MGILSSKPQPAALLAPSMAGDLGEVKRLIGIHIADNDKSTLAAYVNAADPAGNAAIHGAVFLGHLDIAKFLVEACGGDEKDGRDEGVDLTMKNGLGCSPTWIAAGYDRIDCLDYLIEVLRGANKLEVALLDANSTGDTPFLAAASKGNVKACKRLLASTERETTPKDDELKRKILRTANAAGDTALKVAVASAQSNDLLTLLLETDDMLGAHEDSGGESDEAPVHDKCVNRKNNAGLSPLIVACERNLPSTAELLLNHGADICITDAKGRNALAVSAFCGCNDVVEFLLKKEEALAKLLDEKDEKGCTPLWLAARTGNLSMVELLMEAGANPNIADEEGMTPRATAVKFKKEKVMEYFERRDT